MGRAPIGIYLIFQAIRIRFNCPWGFEAALDIRQLPTGAKVAGCRPSPEGGKQNSPGALALGAIRKRSPALTRNMVELRVRLVVEISRELVGRSLSCSDGDELIAHVASG